MNKKELSEKINSLELEIKRLKHDMGSEHQANRECLNKIRAITEYLNVKINPQHVLICEKLAGK